jgi:hypothetical protein
MTRKGCHCVACANIGVRATIDIDVYGEVTTELAERELRAAAAQDIAG